MKVESNILNKTKAYLCGNLQNENWDFVISWREKLSKQLSSLGIVCLSPLDKVFKNFPKEDLSLHTKLFECLEKGDLFTPHEAMKSIRRRDLALIDRSDFIICVLNVDKPTYGTVEELVLAEKQNKKTFIVISQTTKRTPLWLLAMFKPECFYNSLDEVVDELRKINSGEIKITDQNWRIFEDKYL